jgi:formylglycine-generating enzyme required for sulfatase activity
VGTAVLGAGLWGQLDLVGEVSGWNLDWFADNYVDPCTDCVDLTETSSRVFQGGSFRSFLPPNLDYDKPTDRSEAVGLRCARSPP